MWEIAYYESSSGRYPVAKFIESLDVKSKAKIARTIDLLEEFGANLGMPYVRYLENQLWELRVRYSHKRHRIIYFLYNGREFVLLHGFTKKTGPVSRKDINLAEARRNNYLTRGNKSE